MNELNNLKKVRKLIIKRKKNVKIRYLKSIKKF